ncbi:hypothetical protein SBBP2_2280003 [Burkholderiales bacterium]|nr:hypothetical protein SBBP2_2280003 [Burkholderiales bacterium]
MVEEAALFYNKENEREKQNREDRHFCISARIKYGVCRKR